jgi:ATP-binding cassette, subfamily C (CFTR/MRP), member 1
MTSKVPSPVVQIALISTLHQKSLRITSASRVERGAGTIVTLMSNDAAKIWNLPQYMHMLWSGPFQVWVLLVSFVSIISWACQTFENVFVLVG